MPNNIHNKIVLKLGVALFEHKSFDVIELGNLLLTTEADMLSDGGYWIWDYINNQVYYSPNFCKAIGYKFGEIGIGFDGFGLANKEQMNTGMEMLNELMATKSELIFVNNIEYTAKNGTIKLFECSGTVFYKDGQPKYILGTHKIL
jgi:PAS domain-containing protein